MKNILKKRNIINDCWEYTGHLNENGYGNVRHNGKMSLVHRISYEHFIGPISKNMLVRHNPLICNNKKCFNPDHLIIGTAKDNGQDKIVSGTNISVTKGYKKPPKNHLTLNERALWYKNTSLVMEGDCLKPNKTISKDGYVYFEYYSKSYILSRVICAITYNKDLSDKNWEASHSCRNRFCCNPKHLEPLSKKEHGNLQKLYSKVAKLSIEQIREIKSILSTSNPFPTLTKWYKEIGKKYDVGFTCIQRIKLNYTWKDV